jgi:hypothetical protein
MTCVWFGEKYKVEVGGVKVTLKKYSPYCRKWHKNYIPNKVEKFKLKGLVMLVLSSKSGKKCDIMK